MASPATARAIELERTGAWPLVCYAIRTGRLELDLNLAGVKHLTGLGKAVEDCDPAGFAAARHCGPAAGLGGLMGGNRPGWVPGGVVSVRRGGGSPAWAPSGWLVS